jgi:hypothetical protein
MFRFHWEQLVTDELMAEMLRDFQNATPEDREHLKKAMVLVLKKIGGPPITHRPLTDVECARLTRFLINQPILRLLTQPHSVSAPARFEMKKADTGPLRRVAKRLATLQVNEASPSDFVIHGGLSVGVSESIVAERIAHGPFESLEDIVARVDGISPSQRRKLKQVASFRRTNIESSLLSSPSLSKTFGDLVKRVQRRLTARKESSASQAREPRKGMRHRSAIQIASTSMLRAPVHPVLWLDHLKELEINDGDQLWEAVPVECVGILPDRAYYNSLSSLIDGAKQSINLCMFHVVYSSQQHPTRKLLDSLAAAKQRGVSTRVLMDQDRKTDPYHSLIINTPAKEFFEKNGIECRLDNSNFLLHSKYLVIDSTMVIVGSHNWSAGSYFNYRDLSFIVYSDTFARVVNDRFEHQWKRARA